MTSSFARSASYCAFIVAFMLLSPGIVMLQAAPISLRFDATIGTVFSGNPFNSGISFGIGDHVSGRFSFDPLATNSDTVFVASHPYSSILSVNGVTLSTPSFEIQSVDNTVITDFPPANLIDSLQVGASGLAAISNTSGVNIDPGKSSLRMFLYGPANTLSNPSFPPEAIDWNSFDLWRQLVVSFRDGSGGAVGFQATIGPFVMVPEPTGWCAALVVFATIVRTRRQSNH